MRYFDDIPGNREAVATRFIHNMYGLPWVV